MRADTKRVGELDRDRRDPHDQRWIDLDNVNIEFAAGQPAARDIQQPGDVVLQRRAKHGEQDDAQREQQHQHAEHRDPADSRRRWADCPNLGITHWTVSLPQTVPVLFLHSLYGFYMITEIIAMELFHGNESAPAVM